MRITLRIDKSLEQNSGIYFDKAKKNKLKLEGASSALEKSRRMLKKARKAVITITKPVIVLRKKEWYEKFRWFYTSEGFLVIGGRDATTNEIIIKKHTEPGDMVFHTDMAGSPFFVIKSNGKTIGKESIQEAGNATASYSRAWKKGLAQTQVFYVAPDQVSKTAKSGESLPKGAFMIYGKTTYIDNHMRIAIANVDGRIIGGPVHAVKKHTKKFVELIQGSTKTSDIAKMIKKKIGGDIDTIILFLPSGGCNLA